MFKAVSRPIKLWLLPLLLSANFVHWQGEYDAALQRALKEHKALWVLVVKKQDPSTSRMIQKIFMNHHYVDCINQYTVPVIVTYEGKLSYPVEMYYTQVFPTLFMVDARSETLMKVPLFGEEITVNSVKKYTQVLCNKLTPYAK